MKITEFNIEVEYSSFHFSQSFTAFVSKFLFKGASLSVEHAHSGREI